ncbi:TonB-dependent receptor [Terriglobus roseus]|uniref:Carboxypeptidase regulatory-like domain-containing protein n=1 Tax=Terriglobus roseus TaxID=392734 RepID=A0A1H4N3D8_9BACT|nr:carboxypeptidase regulatory-like domain-containing protein [Terriglobus roseus]SEB89821.1 Carboxypeptidase regulatory-like domain-containing protein [Terriglobus roseus]
MMQNKMMRSLALAAVLASAASTVALAQSAVDGAVGGTVHDATGAIVPNAQITVTNNGTNASQTVKTDDQGYFRALHLQPGSYTIETSAPGFGAYKSTAVVVQVGLLTNVDPSLSAAGTTTEVTVTSEIPAINTTSPDFNTVIDSQILGNLPVNNYRWSSYAALTPGVVANSDGFGLLSFRGQSVLQNNITIDGADDNQAFFSEERGRTRAGYSTAQSSIQEFQVNTSNYTVEYGRAVGGVVNSITKSGTNAFHGDLYFRDRDAEWGSKSPTTQLTTITAAGPTTQVIKPKDWRKQYGGGVGGPIIKDKLFFFLAIDKFKRNFPGTGVASSPATFFATPDAALPAGKTCGVSTGAAAPSAVDASNCTLAFNYLGSYSQYAAAVPLYNSGLTGLNSMLGAVPRTGDQNILFPKIDWQINGRNHVAFEVNRLNWASPAGIQTQATNTYGTRSFGDDFVKLTFGIAKLDTVITNNLVNQIRYQYGHDFEYEFAQTPATPYEQSNILTSRGGTYTNPFGLPPNVFITNGFNFGTQTFLQRPRYPDERRWQVAETANWTHGSHNVKFGMDYIHTYDLSQNLRSQYGSYSYTTVGAYLGDLLNGSSANPALVAKAKNYSSYQQAFGPLAFDFVTHDIGIFAQDEWKATRNLSITYGLRYELQLFPPTYPGLPVTGGNFGANAIAATGVMPSDKNNIAPRVGFAWDPFGNGRTSVRGGYGIFFGRTSNSTIYSALTSTGNAVQNAAGIPLSQLTFNYTSTQAGAPSFPAVIGSVGTAGAAPASTYFNPGFQNPYSQQFDLSIQRDLGWHTTLGASYIGALGREMPNFVDANLPTPSTTVTYTVADSTGKGPLANGSKVTTRFYAKGAAATVAAGVNGPNAYASSQRPNPVFGAVTAIVSNASSSYNAVIVEAKHQFTSGLSFNVNYTYAHALDNGVNATTFTSANAYTDPLNPAADYGNSDNNVPHRIVAYAVYQTPKYFHGPVGYALNSWEISPSFAGQSGLPYSLASSGTPTTALGDNGATLSAIGGGINGSNGAFRIANIGRNTYKLPRTMVADLRVSKRFDLRDNMNFELLIESFNIANHYNTTAVTTTGYTLATSATANTLTYGPSFGTRTSVNSNLSYSPRQVQVGARFHF